jgi:DNA-directed RNA polymerase subunit M/transcription elongation factor TFIIS
MRYWECECCGSLLVTLPQDSAELYKCPQCGKVKCDHGGRYAEVTADFFAKLAGLAVPNVKVRGPL